jgi:P27 family predicted phage terminase small subunit
MARPPKTVEQHKQDGTYQKCRHADRGTNMEPVKSVSCPEKLTGEARKLWDTVVPRLCSADLVTEADKPVLEHAFHCYGLAVDLHRIAEKHEGGEAAYIASLTRMDKDVVYESLRYMQEFDKIMYKFGMTPVERARIRGNVKPSDEDEDSTIKSLIGNG